MEIQPVTPRDAATLILLRPSPQGMRVLMGLRHAGHKFQPNRMVFPGGGVDAQDFGAKVAAPLASHVLAKLEHAAPPPLAAALGHAAARELQEETGLSLGNPPDLSGLDYLCRAVTPSGRPIRFNARFFVGPASLVSGELAGSGELESLDWHLIKEVLKLNLVQATASVLVHLQSWLRLDEPARRAIPAKTMQDGDWDDTLA